jgi:hypothetical protein
MRIITELQYDNSYIAYDDCTYDGPGSVVGQAWTPIDAVQDFVDAWHDRHDVDVVDETDGQVEDIELETYHKG